MGGISTQGVTVGTGLQGFRLALHDAMLDGLRQHRSYLAMRPCAHLLFTGLSGIMRLGDVVLNSSFVPFFVLCHSVKAARLGVPLLLYKEVITCRRYRIE